MKFRDVAYVIERSGWEEWLITCHNKKRDRTAAGMERTVSLIYVEEKFHDSLDLTGWEGIRR